MFFVGLFLISFSTHAQLLQNQSFDESQEKLEIQTKVAEQERLRAAEMKRRLTVRAAYEKKRASEKSREMSQ